MGERAPSRHRVGYSVEADDFLPATIAMIHPTNKFRRVVHPRLLPKVSLHGGPSIVSSFETPRHFTNYIAPFSRAPLNINIALFIAIFPKLCVCVCACVCVYLLNCT